MYFNKQGLQTVSCHTFCENETLNSEYMCRTNLDSAYKIKCISTINFILAVFQCRKRRVGPDCQKFELLPARCYLRVRCEDDLSETNAQQESCLAVKEHFRGGL